MAVGLADSRLTVFNDIFIKTLDIKDRLAISPTATHVAHSALD
jgi:hypothetical protein